MEAQILWLTIVLIIGLLRISLGLSSINSGIKELIKLRTTNKTCH